MIFLHICDKQLVCIVDKTMFICFGAYERNRSLQAICIHYILYNCKKIHLYSPTVNLLTLNKNTMNILTCFTFIKYFLHSGIIEFIPNWLLKLIISMLVFPDNKGQAKTDDKWRWWDTNPACSSHSKWWLRNLHMYSKGKWRHNFTNWMCRYYQG